MSCKVVLEWCEYARKTVDETYYAYFDTPESEKHGLFERNDQDASDDSIGHFSWVC
jgi:hypothetical protein